MESHQAKFKCCIEWLAGSASACTDSGLNQTTLGPLYHPYSSSNKLKQKVVDLLTSPVVYCAVYNSLLSPDEQLSSTSFWPLIQHLARRGVYLMEDDETALNHTVLASRTPFKQGAHAVLIDGLMRGYVSSLGIRERVVKAVRRIAGLSASKELPNTIEEALLLWLNKTSEAVCKRHHLVVEQMHSETNPTKRRQNKMKLMSDPGPMAIPKSSDLAMAVAHGQCLAAVVLHYFPSSFSYSDFNFRADLLTEEETMHNLNRVRLACTSFLPLPALHVLPELLLWWAPSGLLTDNITAMIALLFDHLEPLHGTTFKASSLSASISSSLTSASGKKQPAASPKEDKSKRLPNASTGQLLLPKLSRQSLTAQNLYSASMMEMSTDQSPGSAYFHTPQVADATAFENRRSSQLSSFSASMISDSGHPAVGSHFPRQTPRGMVFVAPVKAHQGAILRSSINTSLMKQQKHQKLISASVENLASLPIKERPLDCSEQLQPTPTIIVPTQSTTNSLSSTNETRVQPSSQPARPKSRELPKIKFIRESSSQHTDNTTLSSSTPIEATDNGDSSTSTERKTAVEFFVDLDQIPSQDANRDHVLRSSYTLEKSTVSHVSEKSEPPSTGVEKDNIADTKTEQHQISLTVDDGVRHLSVFVSETNQDDPVSSPCLDPDKVLLRMKLRAQQRSITQRAIEKEEERASKKSEMLMRVFFKMSQPENRGRQVKEEKQKPAQESSLHRPIPPVTSPNVVTTALKGRKLFVDDSQAENKPATSNVIVKSDQGPTHEDMSATNSSSSVVVECTRVIVPASAATQPEPPKSLDTETGELLTDQHDRHKMKKQELMKARLVERDRQRREAAQMRKQEQRAHRRLMSAAGSLGSGEAVRSGLFYHQQGAVLSDPLASGSAYSLSTSINNGDHRLAIPAHTGPECYIRPPVKTNKKLIKNALCFVCLAGEANISTKQRALAELDSSFASHFIILFRNTLGCKFKAFYGYQPEDDKITKIFGTGPKVIKLDMVIKFFKYNSGAKEFRPVHSRLFSIFIDALAIHDHFWGKKR